MAETLKKIALYFRATDPYWHAAPETTRETDPTAYPLDFGPRLRDGHFAHFDAAGVPLRMTAAGAVHNYTRICGWALAHWSTASAGQLTEKSRAAFLDAADYIVRTGVRVRSELLLRAEIPGSGHVGPISAMSQGQAISVLVRAERLTGDGRYGEAAGACLGPFARGTSSDGVAAAMIGIDGTWFEEYTQQPPRHILNGMIFALWGLDDLERHMRNQSAAALKSEGMRALSSAIARFDTGWWSTYDAPDILRPYIASMRYHDLHVAQLEALALDVPEFLSPANRFRGYAESARGRLRAAASIGVAKLRRDFRHEPDDASRPG